MDLLELKKSLHLWLTCDYGQFDWKQSPVGDYKSFFGLLDDNHSEAQRSNPVPCLIWSYFILFYKGNF